MSILIDMYILIDVKNKKKLSWLYTTVQKMGLVVICV